MTEQVQYLQKRVALFGKVCFAVTSFGLLLRVVMILIMATPAELGQQALHWHALGVVAALALWLLCRTGAYSETFIRGAETAVLLITSVVMAMMGRSLSERFQQLAELKAGAGAVSPFILSILREYASLIVVFSLLGMLVLRTVLVPGTARRTLALGVMMGATMIIALEYKPEMAQLPLRSLSTVAFWLMSVALCVVLSAVIHGLRKEARHARTLGSYTLETKLGEGGMGEVYRARHAMLRRPTAVKLLHTDHVGERSLARFENEVQLTARLTHPNTVTVFDYGRTPDGVFYYVMELLDGATIEQVVEVDGAQPVARVVSVMRMVCGALAEAHEMGLIHRDIKPANIVLAKRGGRYDVAKVVDFGLVKDLAQQDPGLSHDDTVTGTPMYMPPEALTSPEQVDARSDLYALGAVAYFMLTGETVFSGNSAVEVLSHHLHSKPTPPSARMKTSLDAALERLVLSCLAKSQDERPQSASALASALQALQLPAWSDEDSQRWWSQHDSAIARLKGKETSLTIDNTVAVDLSARS